MDKKPTSPIISENPLLPLPEAPVQPKPDINGMFPWDYAAIERAIEYNTTTMKSFLAMGGYDCQFFEADTNSLKKVYDFLKQRATLAEQLKANPEGFPDAIAARIGEKTTELVRDVIYGIWNVGEETGSF